MKKLFKILLGVVLFVVAFFLIAGLFMPKDIVVSRSAFMNAPKDAVFNQMVHFKNWTNWSPWYKMDTNVKMTYSGNDGTAGSAYHWVGEEKKTGEGDMKNLAVNGTQMDFEVIFSKPNKGEAKGTLKAEDSATGTKATWTFSMHMSYPLNAMCLFMNMDKMLGSDFEKGLGNMKSYLESNKGASNQSAIKEIDFPAKIYACIRKTVGWNEMSAFFGESYGKLGQAVGAKIAGPAVGLYYTWDTVKKCSDMAAAFPVTDASLKGVEIAQIPACKAFMAVQKGGYSGSMQIHLMLKNHIQEKGLQQSLVIEEYLVGPHEEADSNKWVTNVYYLIK